jgi:hypothetical protein
MRRLSTLLFSLLAIACTGIDTGKDSADTAGGDEAGGDGTEGTGGDEGGGDEGGEPEPIHGSLSGTVTVEMYEYNADGDAVSLSWEASGNEYPFGKIFVGAFYTDEMGTDHYVGTDVIDEPTIEPNAFDIDFSAEGNQSVWVYASMDYYQDGVVGSSDPRGVWPVEIPIEDGTEVTGIDIRILTPYYSGGGGCDTMNISGEVIITVSYSDGDVATMLVDTAGYGPYHVGYAEMSGLGGGASGTYSFDSCVGYGDMNLIGVWDSNLNGMFDPDDRSGTYAATPDTDTNPVSVGTDDLAGYDIQIPLGDGMGISVVPFVRIFGDLSMADGSGFDALPAGTTVHVAALFYKPGPDFAVSSIPSLSYDYVVYEWDDLAGLSSVPYTLTLPANTATYLWAFADVDNDGVVNEAGEPVASSLSDVQGRVIVTEESIDRDLGLVVVD